MCYILSAFYIFQTCFVKDLIHKFFLISNNIYSKKKKKQKQQIHRFFWFREVTNYGRLYIKMFLITYSWSACLTFDGVLTDNLGLCKCMVVQCLDDYITMLSCKGILCGVFWCFFIFWLIVPKLKLSLFDAFLFLYLILYGL